MIGSRSGVLGRAPASAPRAAMHIPRRPTAMSTSVSTPAEVTVYCVDWLAELSWRDKAARYQHWPQLQFAAAGAGGGGQHSQAASSGHRDATVSRGWGRRAVNSAQFLSLRIHSGQHRAAVAWQVWAPDIQGQWAAGGQQAAQHPGGNCLVRRRLMPCRLCIPALEQAHAAN